jgi:hypothetical protein
MLETKLFSDLNLLTIRERKDLLDSNEKNFFKLLNLLEKEKNISAKHIVTLFRSYLYQGEMKQISDFAIKARILNDDILILSSKFLTCIKGIMNPFTEYRECLGDKDAMYSKYEEIFGKGIIHDEGFETVIRILQYQLASPEFLYSIYKNQSSYYLDIFSEIIACTIKYPSLAIYETCKLTGVFKKCMYILLKYVEWLESNNYMDNTLKEHIFSAYASLYDFFPFAIHRYLSIFGKGLDFFKELKIFIDDTKLTYDRKIASGIYNQKQYFTTAKESKIDILSSFKIIESPFSYLVIEEMQDFNFMEFKKTRDINKKINVNDLDELTEKADNLLKNILSHQGDIKNAKDYYLFLPLYLIELAYLFGLYNSDIVSHYKYKSIREHYVSILPAQTPFISVFMLIQEDLPKKGIFYFTDLLNIFGPFELGSVYLDEITYKNTYEREPYNYKFRSIKADYRKVSPVNTVNPIEVKYEELMGSSIDETFSENLIFKIANTVKLSSLYKVAEEFYNDFSITKNLLLLEKRKADKEAIEDYKKNMEKIDRQRLLSKYKSYIYLILLVIFIIFFYHYG